MSTTSASPVFAPFAVKSFRFQWPADLAVAWAFEMEALILGWYVLVATGSVKLLVLYGAVQWAGSLFSPMFGVAGDRFGHRRILCVTRATYAVLASILTVLTLSGQLVPWHVFTIATIVGLIRPSDMVMRNALIAQIMPPPTLLGALSLSRTTTDTARIAGALAGAGGVAVFGMGAAYVVITSLYALSFVLSLRVAAPPPRAADAAVRPTPLRDLREAFTYVWARPDLLGAMTVAFFVNLLAFPFFLGLLPYIAKEVYAVGQAGLGYLAASFALGGLIGSLAISARRVPMAAGRTMLWAGAAWFVTVLVFAHASNFAFGLVMLLVAGVFQNLCLMPLAALMLHRSEPHMRGRVMGMRMLAIWGLPAGLLLSGPLIGSLGFAATASLYAGLGLVLMLVIAMVWRRALWDPAAPANGRD